MIECPRCGESFPTERVIRVHAKRCGGATAQEPRQQHYGFAHVLLKNLAFERPDETVDLLRGPRGAPFLQSVWSSAGQTAAKLGDTSQYESAPTCTPREFGALIGALVTMPHPSRMTECYFIALASSRSTAFAAMPALADGMRALLRERGQADLMYFTLEWSLSAQSTPCAVLCSWNASGAHHNYSKIVEATEEAFLAAVSAIVTSGPAVTSHE